MNTSANYLKVTCTIQNEGFGNDEDEWNQSPKHTNLSKSSLRWNLEMEPDANVLKTICLEIKTDIYV